jgi:hypothetical protein
MSSVEIDSPRWVKWSEAECGAAPLPAQEEAQVSGSTKAAIAIGVIGLILLFINPLIGVILIAAGIAIPVGAYLMLDPSQRRRLREIRRRRQIGH